MALTKVMDAETAIVDLATAQEFTIAGEALVDQAGLKVGQYVIVNKLMSDGNFHPVTTLTKTLTLTAEPNIRILDAIGTYKITKPQVTDPVTCGYELLVPEV